MSIDYSLLSRKTITARKNHRCVWCWCSVLERSKYVLEISSYENRFQNFAWHESCRKAADDYFNDVGDGEFTSGNEMPFYELYKLEAVE